MCMGFHADISTWDIEKLQKEITRRADMLTAGEPSLCDLNSEVIALTSELWRRAASEPMWWADHDDSLHVSDERQIDWDGDECDEGFGYFEPIDITDIKQIRINMNNWFYGQGQQSTWDDESPKPVVDSGEDKCRWGGEHQFVDTGMKKGWCKKCNRDAVFNNTTLKWEIVK